MMRFVTSIYFLKHLLTLQYSDQLNFFSSSQIQVLLFLAKSYFFLESHFKGETINRNWSQVCHKNVYSVIFKIINMFILVCSSFVIWPSTFDLLAA